MKKTLITRVIWLLCFFAQPFDRIYAEEWPGFQEIENSGDLVLSEPLTNNFQNFDFDKVDNFDDINSSATNSSTDIPKLENLPTKTELDSGNASIATEDLLPALEDDSVAIIPPKVLEQNSTPQADTLINILPPPPPPKVEIVQKETKKVENSQKDRKKENLAEINKIISEKPPVTPNLIEKVDKKTKKKTITVTEQKNGKITTEKKEIKIEISETKKPALETKKTIRRPIPNFSKAQLAEQAQFNTLDPCIDGAYENTIYQYSRLPSHEEKFKIKTKIPCFLYGEQESKNKHLNKIYTRNIYMKVLLDAIENENIPVVDRVLTAFKNDQIFLPGGETLGTYAAKHHKVRVLRYLVMRSHNLLDIPNTKGETVHSIAIECRNFDIIKLLKKIDS